MNRNAGRLTGCGIGLRKEHHDTVLKERPRIPFFEVISENFMAEGGRPRDVLERVRRDYPVALHGVSLSLGSAEPLDRAYLARLARLIDWVRPVLVSDHLCWTGLGGHNSHDLLPMPFTEEAVTHVARKIREVQDFLERRILVENISSYVEYRESTLSEADFLVAVLEEADCDLLLDVNNLYVNARNHGLSPEEALDLLPPGRLRQIHLAGHEDNGAFVVDTHDGPVSGAVWDLYRQTIERFGPVPTLIEWDAQLPPLGDLLEEARRAESILATAISDDEVRRSAARALGRCTAEAVCEVAHAADAI